MFLLLRGSQLEEENTLFKLKMLKLKQNKGRHLRNSSGRYCSSLNQLSGQRSFQFPYNIKVAEIFFVESEIFT